jgi:hypothetical protein
VRKQTENDAISQRVLLNLGTLQKNKKVEEQEKKIWLYKKNKTDSPLSGGENDSQAAYLKP